MFGIKTFFKKNRAQMSNLKHEIIFNRLTLGKLLERDNINNTAAILADIQKSEFKIFSQWGDDGIINFLINYLDDIPKTFVEFGVENYTESNTRFLLINNNWSGLIMDGSDDNIAFVKSENLFWQQNLTSIADFITAENIDNLLINNGFIGELCLLHIDIDGNDYWVWKAIKAVDPIIVIVEYNSLFGADNPWTTLYDPSFVRTKSHYSNLLYGTSLLSICDLAAEKGYGFIGCNSNGNNAYFVRKDKLKDLRELTVTDGYVKSQFSEGRDKDGNLVFARGEERLIPLQGLDIYNTRTEKIEKIQL